MSYELYEKLREPRERSPKTGSPRGRARIWRVSHLGGHRFAPTAIELPTLRQWAFLTPEAAERILSRCGDCSELRRHYRGWAGLGSAWEQVLEREVLDREGWPATQWPMEGRVVEVAGAVSAPESCRAGAVADFPRFRVVGVEALATEQPLEANS